MINYNNQKIITCQVGCGGQKDLCIPIVLDYIIRGFTVFMIYGAYVQEKLEEHAEYNLEFEYRYQNGIKIGMWIALKD
jgi:hypothetical protein